MIRTVPSSGNQDIKLYLRTYYSLLRSTRPVQITTLVEAHKRMRSALHVHANDPQPDMAAFIYSIFRLPPCMDKIKFVVMGQSERVFKEHGFPDVENWESVTAPGRRRRSYFDGKNTLAVYIASRSDIDDLVPILTAYQIEQRKLHHNLNKPTVFDLLLAAKQHDGRLSAEDLLNLSQLTTIPIEDFGRLNQVWGQDMVDQLLALAYKKQSIEIRSLAGSLADYKRATHRWWQNVEKHTPDIDYSERPVYFISSNTHSMANLVGGYALQNKKTLQKYIESGSDEELLREYHDILDSNVPSSMENFLYYILKKYQASHPRDYQKQIQHEKKLGISRIPSKHAFDIEVQVVCLEQLQTDLLDPRIRVPGVEAIVEVESDALLVNIDYPLGMAAYQVLSEIARNAADIKGIYVMGKAATLNGHIGDVMIPGVIHDEQSLNTYLFQNDLTANDIAPYLAYGTVMDNQKAISVPGTFLQNEGYMSVFYHEGFTDMEMEAGPFLSGVYEMIRPVRYPYDELVNLHNAKFPIGIAHYASDTPFSKGKNLGARNLSYYGMDPTYATMIAILRAIFKHEITGI